MLGEDAMRFQWYETTKSQSFLSKQADAEAGSAPHTLRLTGTAGPALRGFGGCFNELGYRALGRTDAAHRREILNALFGASGLNLGFCRIPVGANDYAEEWYSCDETDGDFALSSFSIERDRKYLIPYIREAQAVHPDMTFFASPWSPPVWMKRPKAYNYGTIRMEPEVLTAYARYLGRFVQSYGEEGIPIVQLHVQNEPFADQKFPSCVWKPEDLRVFIRDYLGPLFENESIPAEIFLGTLNGPEEMSLQPFGGVRLQNYHKFVDAVLFDDDARRYIRGAGYQWAGRSAVERTHRSFPELELVQTENECGDGRNGWEYAQYMFDLMCRYFHSGVTAYTYWNMVLEPGGESTWGWKQNSMVTVFPDGKTVYNPEFYVMKHFSHFLRPGAVLLETEGHWTGAAAVFRNPDGTKAAVVQNALDRAERMTLEQGSDRFTVTLEPDSLNTFVFR